MSVYNAPGAEGEIKVWYIPQVPMAAFEVQASDLATARAVLHALEQFSYFEYQNRVKPDYADAGGICRFTDGEWEDFDEEEMEQTR